MWLNPVKMHLKRVRAFQKVFLDEQKKLTPQAQTVIAFLRDEAGARGELGINGVPYFYDKNNRFDANAAAFLLGKRHMFDLIIKYLSLDERAVFNLLSQEEIGDETAGEALHPQPRG